MVIVDLNLGNIGSIQNMVKKIGISAEISNNVDVIAKASKLILPGVGAFDRGMNQIKSLGLMDILNKKVKDDRTPILGICLGMQLLTHGSEEGVEKGLGWIDAHTIKFDFEGRNNLRVPHMGWNNTHFHSDAILFDNMYDEARFYYVHSYHVICNDNNDCVATCQYGINVCAAIQNSNVFGTQFHPEKSHKFGQVILKNFAEC